MTLQTKTHVCKGAQVAPDLLTLEKEVTHVSSEGISAELKSF